MPSNDAPPGAILQYRKGGEVLLARAAGGKSGKTLAVGEDGKRLELTPDRVLQVAGQLAAALSDAEVRVRLREVRGAAEALVPAIDLALLWEQARESPDGAPIADLAALYFGRSGSPEERLAFGFALCADRVHFRQKGDRFVPRSQKEVDQALEQREAERRAAERRAALLAWIHEGLVAKHWAAEPPAHAQAEVAALVDYAVRGDESEHAARAKALLREVDAGKGHGAPSYPPTPDGAFDLLVRLGIFEPHESLAARRNNLPASFAPALEEAARAVPRYEPGAPGADGPGPAPRRTLPAGVAAVTIDDAETLDRDDAITIEPLEGGRVRAGVHIADAAHFIAKGSPLDEEAARRGTTVYLPRMKVPMFPPVLSEERMSLDADGRPRPALSFFATFDASLAVVEEELAETEVVIAQNLSYEEVDAAIDGSGPDRWGAAATLDAIGRALSERRVAAGALDLRTPEVRILVDAAGAVTLKRIETRSPARAHVAELMILANVIAAHTCRDRGIPAIFRRQSAPAEPLPSRESCPSPEVYAFEVRRRLARTDLGPEPGPHFTLGIECYVQATSPIRRYQDLVVERQLKAWLRGAPLPYSPEEVLAVAGSAEATAGETAAAEREANLYWLIHWLLERRGAALDAVVLMEREGKFLVELCECLHRVFVKTRARWQVGERVKVRVDGGNPRRGELFISPA